MSEAALPPPPAPAVPEAATPVLAPRLAQPSLAIPARLSPPPPRPSLCLLQHCSGPSPAPGPRVLPAPGACPPHTLLLPSQRAPALSLQATLPPGGPAPRGGALEHSTTQGADQRHEGFPPPPPDSRQPFLQPLPPLSARGEGASLLAKGPRPWHPMLTWRPRPSGAPPGRVRGQLCPSTSRAHTLPATPWIAGREGSGGRNATPWSPWNSPRGPGALREQGEEEGSAPSLGRKLVLGSVLREASGKCFEWFARTRRRGAGAWLGPFTPSFPMRCAPPCHQRWDPSRHPHPLRKHGDPGPPCAHPQMGCGQACATSPVLRSSRCAHFRVCVCVRVSVCVRCRVVKLCPSPVQTREWPPRPRLCNFRCVS